MPGWIGVPRKLPEKVIGARGTDIFEGHGLAEDVWELPALRDFAEYKKYKNTGLIAFSYLWRRFGPSPFGCDSYKDLVRYIISTPNPEVFLTLGLSGSNISLCVGYAATEQLVQEARKPRNDWWQIKFPSWCREVKGIAEEKDIWEVSFRGELIKEAIKDIGDIPQLDRKNWREQEGAIYEINYAVACAMEELLRPVYIRDIGINIFGRYEGNEVFTDYFDDLIADGEDTEKLMEAAPRYKYAGYGIPIDLVEEHLEEEYKVSEKGKQ